MMFVSLRAAEHDKNAKAVVKDVLKMATPARWKVKERALISCSNFGKGPCQIFDRFGTQSMKEATRNYIILIIIIIIICYYNSYWIILYN